MAESLRKRTFSFSLVGSQDELNVNGLKNSKESIVSNRKEGLLIKAGQVR